MSDIATRLRQCAADIRRTPVRLDTWIPLQQEAADTIDALRAEVDAFREDAANYYRVAKEADAQQAALRARVADLSMLVRRLSRYAPPGLAGDALDYLKRHGLEGSPMRDAGNKSEVPK